MALRFVPRVSTKVGPFNVGVSAYSTPSRDPRRAYMANDRGPARTAPTNPRPADTARHTMRTAQDYRRAMEAHERAMAAIERQASRDGVFFTPTHTAPQNVPANPWHMRPASAEPYSLPRTHRAKMQRPARPATHKPFGFYLCVMVAMVLGAFVSLGVLGMILTAAHVLPATTPSVTPTHVATVTHTGGTHSVITTGGAAHQ